MIKRLLLVFIKRGKKGNKFDIKVEQRWECNCFKRKKKGRKCAWRQKREPALHRVRERKFSP